MRTAKYAWVTALALTGAGLPLPAAADTLATGDPADLLDIDDQFIDGLNAPTSMAFLPDGKILVTEKGGAFKIFDADGTPLDDNTAHYVAGTFTVDSSSEKGLLSVLPHPDFDTNRTLIFYYSRSGADDDATNRVASFALDTDNTLDMGSEQVLVDDIWGPANHDGGGLSIYEDYLFVGVGDTGCNKSPTNAPPRNYFATCLTNPNGKILRINLDGTIPSDNPLASETMVTSCEGACPHTSGYNNNDDRCGQDGNLPNCDGDAPSMLGAPRSEIYAWGFRNPWRLWADPQTGNVWVGDVGEGAFEEVDVIPPGGGLHFGWPYREAESGQATTVCTDATSPSGGECTDPVYACPHGNDCRTIAGGFIIDDCTWPTEFQGRYIFGDYSQGKVRTIAVNSARNDVTGTADPFVPDAPIDGGPVHLAMGPDHSLYYVAIAGYIVKITPKMLLECPEPGTGGAGGMSSGGAAGGGGKAGMTSGGAGGTSGGAGGAIAGGGGKAGATGSGGSGSGSDSSDDSGCGCRVAGQDSNAALGLLGLSASALVLGFRRRRSQRR